MSQSHGGLGRLWKWSYLRVAQRFEPASNNQVCWHHIWKAAWGDESSRDGSFFSHPPPSLLIPLLIPCNLLRSARRHSACGLRCLALCWPIRKGRSIIKHCFYAKTVAVLMFEKPRWKLVIAIVMSATAIGIVYIVSSRWSTAVEQFVLISFSSQIDSSFVSFDWISQTSSFDRSDDGYCLSRGRNHFFLLHFLKKMRHESVFFLLFGRERLRSDMLGLVKQVSVRKQEPIYAPGWNVYFLVSHWTVKSKKLFLINSDFDCAWQSGKNPSFQRERAHPVLRLDQAHGSRITERK